MLFLGVKNMKDYLEMMSFCAFDMDLMSQIVNDILEEAGLDVEKVPAESLQQHDQRLHSTGDLRCDRP